MANHAKMSRRKIIEVGGILIGTVERVYAINTQDAIAGPIGYLVTVTDIVEMALPDASENHVKFDDAALSQLNGLCADKYSPQGKVRVGWYHTHPTQGIFYSPQDIDSHMVWRLPFQFGLVIDPPSMQCGLFHWHNLPNSSDSPSRARDCLAGPILFNLVDSPGQAGRHREWRAQPAALPPPNHTHSQPVPVVGSPNTFRPDGVDPSLVLVVGVILLSLLAPLAFVGLFVMPARFEKFQLPQDPTYLILAAIACVYVVFRLWKARGAARSNQMAHAPEHGWAWWRAFGVLGGLVAGGGWLYWAGPVDRAIALGGYGFFSLLLMAECWGSGVFHPADPAESRVARWCWATARKAWEFIDRGLRSLVRGSFAYAINPGTVIGGLVIIAGLVGIAILPDSVLFGWRGGVGLLLFICGLLIFPLTGWLRRRHKIAVSQSKYATSYPGAVAAPRADAVEPNSQPTDAQPQGSIKFITTPQEASTHGKKTH
jgi:proteasome lid subunit RPN8/RPN11